VHWTVAAKNDVNEGQPVRRVTTKGCSFTVRRFVDTRKCSVAFHGSAVQLCTQYKCVQVMADLDGLVDDNLKVHMVGSPLRKGTAGLKEQLAHFHDYVGSMRPGKALYCASTENDSVFCLLECQEVPGSEGGSPSDETHKAYAIAKFEILLDDTALRITDIHERFQLGPADAPLLAAHSPMHTSMRAALKEAGISHFPSNIKEMGIDRYVDLPSAARSMCICARGNVHLPERPTCQVLHKRSYLVECQRCDCSGEWVCHRAHAAIFLT